MKGELVPRYAVLLPEGEVEMDAQEIFALFHLHKVDLQTMIRPVESGDWRKIGDEKGFVPLLPALYFQARQIWWFPLLFFIFLGIFPLTYYLSMNSEGWPDYWRNNCRTMIFCFVLFMGTLLDRTRLTFWRLGLLMIPWWNSVEGYRAFQRVSSELPSSQARLIRWINPFVWISLAAFYCSFFFVPADVSGGYWIAAVYELFWCLLGICAIPVILALKRSDAVWRISNPKPVGCKEKSPGWSRFGKRNIIAWGLALSWLLLCLFTAALVFLTPWRIIGEIRWDKSIKYEFPALPEPHAAPELMKIVLPEITVGDVASVDAGGKIPNTRRAELKKIEPQLNDIRGILRKYPMLGLRGETYPSCPQSIEICNETLHKYLLWRRLELHAGGGFREILRDLERRTEYAAEEPITGINHLELETRMKIVAGHLRAFTDGELEQEKKCWEKLSELTASVISGNIFVRDNRVTESLLNSRWRNHEQRFLLFFFGDGLRATFLEYSLELDDLLARDVWQSRDDLAKFQSKMNRLGGIHRLWATCSDMIKKDVENSSGESSTVLTQANQASRFRAICRLAEAGIGLEQYRRQNGRYPEKPELPADPFDGKPLRYLPGVAVYSVGPDLKDDLGNPKPGDNGMSPDIVFSLEEGMQ